MKKNSVRAALLACVSLFALGTFAAPAAAASDSSKPTISKAASKPVGAAMKAVEAKDWPTAIAKLKEAQALSDLSDYDKYVIATYFGLAYYSSGDTVSAATSFVQAAETPGAPDSERAAAYHRAISLEYNNQDYAKVIELGQSLNKSGVAVGNDDLAILASADYNTGDFANALVYAQKAIAAATAAGQAPDRTMYEVVLSSQNKQKDVPGEIKTLDGMAGLYGNAEDWGRLIDLTLSQFNSPGRTVAALSLYRLRLVTGAESAADDYTLMAQLALELNSPGDADHALHTGIDKGILPQAKAGALLAKTNARLKGDEAGLAAAEAVAAKSPASNGDVSVAEDYFGYGRYGDAARVAARAVSKGGAKQGEAQLTLGSAQAMQNDPAAAATLGGVAGDSSLEQAANLWKVYATRKYGQPGAAPAK